MRSKSTASLLTVLLAALALALAARPVQSQCPLVPLVGTYLEIDQFPDSSAVIELAPSMERINLMGPTTVHVAIGPAGEAVDTDGDGLDQVKTQIIQMHLTGDSSFGPVTVEVRPVSEDPFGCTAGEIEETVNTMPGRLDVPPFAPSGTANSFFDVFFEITVDTANGDLVLHNRIPKRMQTLIRHKPPAEGDTYENPQTIPLFNEDNTPSPFSLGASRHVPDPEPGRPVCIVKHVTNGVDATVSDAGTGLATIEVTRQENATVTVPGFPIGSKGPVVVMARKDPPGSTLRSVVELRITDVSGNSILCDPVLTLQIRERGKPVSETVTGLPQAESQVSLLNGSPGVTTLRIEVNGRSFLVTGLKDGEQRTLDISSALQPGNDNVVRLTAQGKPGGSVEIAIHD